MPAALRQIRRLFDFIIPVRVELNLAQARAALQLFLRERNMQVRVQLIGLDRLGYLKIPDLAATGDKATLVASALAWITGAAGASLGDHRRPVRDQGRIQRAVLGRRFRRERRRGQNKAVKTAVHQRTSAEKAARDAKKDNKDAEKPIQNLNLEVRGGLFDLFTAAFGPLPHRQKMGS